MYRALPRRRGSRSARSTVAAARPMLAIFTKWWLLWSANSMWPTSMRRVSPITPFKSASVCSGRSKDLAKSAPDPAATTPRLGRASGSVCMMPFTTSLTVPSPPTATTVVAPAAAAITANSEAWPGCLVA